MNNFRQILLILISVLLFNGCHVYYPQSTDIPLIKEKQELRVDGGVSLYYPSISGTVSYGLTDKIAVQVSGNSTPTTIQIPESSTNTPVYLLSAAVGLYKFNPKNNWTKELYVGFGNGYAADAYYDDYHSGSLYGNYQIYYVQGNIGRRDIKLKFLEYAFGLKLGLINTHFSVDDVYTRTGQRPIIKCDELGALVEPVISLKLGGERLMFNIKPSVCYIKKLSTNIDPNTNQYYYDSRFEYPYFPFGLGLSLNYRFSK